jgi:hypothetical protein
MRCRLGYRHRLLCEPGVKEQTQCLRAFLSHPCKGSGARDLHRRPGPTSFGSWLLCPLSVLSYFIGSQVLA